jgi:hypothetical protein
LKKLALAAALVCAGAATPALAAPGLGEEVYGATVEKGEVELEARYGNLSGGPSAGDDNMRFEAGYGVTHNLSLSAVVELERADGEPRKVTHLGLEAVYHLGRVAGVDVAAYQEFEFGLNGDPNGSETKLLLEKRSRIWDLRFNLIGEKPFDSHEPLGLSYAASADAAVSRRLRLGVTAFGDLGTFHHFAPAAEHYAGPVAKYRIPMFDRDGDDDKGIVIEAGYLFALGATRQQTNGQFRLNLEFEL